MIYFKYRDRPCGITIKVSDTDEGPITVHKYVFKYPECDELNIKKMNKQTEILKLLRPKETMTFQEIVDQAPFGYYRNAKHYIGQILTSMVRNGKIKRVKRGVYKYVKDVIIKKDYVDPNQIKLL